MFQFRLILIFLCVTVLAGSPWYLLNLILAPHHNPIFPLGVEVRGHMLLQPVDRDYLAGSFAFHHIPDHIREAIEDDHWPTVLTGALDPWHTNYHGAPIGGMGAVFGILMVPAIPVALLWAAWHRNWNVVVLMLCIVGSFVVFPQHTWSRFILPVTLAGFVAFGYVLRRIDQ